MRILSITSSYPRYEGDRYGLFIHELNNEVAKTGNYIAALVPLAYGFKNINPQKNLTIYRFQYFFPSKFQRLSYGYGMFVNVKMSMLAKLQLPFFLMAELLGAMWLISKERIEIIHAHWIIPQGLIAVILKALFNVPVIVTVHGTDLRECPRIIRRYILNNADAIVTPHPELKEILSREGYDVKEVKKS